MAPPRRTARDYEGGITAASRTGLAEILTTLGAYGEALAIIGGWAPHLILERFGDPAGAVAFAEHRQTRPRFRALVEGRRDRATVRPILGHLCPA